MKIALISCLLCGILAISGAYGQETTGASEDTNKKTPTTAAPTTAAPTTAAPTTAAPTTAAPTTAAPTTTAAPPKPITVNETVNTYLVKDPTNSSFVCIKAVFSAHFQHKKEVLNISTTATVDKSSTCTQLVINFPGNDLTLTFTNDTKAKNYIISQVDANIKFPSEDKQSVGAVNLTSCKVSYGSSYLCKSGVDFDLTSKTMNATLHIKNLQMQLGMFNATDDFYIAEKCDLNILVPIIVGAVLAGLIVIVVIAYFIGRSRSRGGYEEI